MGGGNDPHVHGRQPTIGTESLNLTRLEKSQEEGLHPQAHLTHFIHEDAAAMSSLEPPALVAVSVGEAAPEMTEELRFQKGVGKASTVDRDERSTGASTVFVDHARHDFFADTALARNEHLGVGLRRVQDFLLNTLDGSARTNHQRWLFHGRPQHRREQRRPAIDHKEGAIMRAPVTKVNILVTFDASIHRFSTIRPQNY
jgi:hypothetical protein